MLFLGVEVQTVALKLTRNSDFIAGIDSESGTWPAGCTVSIVVGEVSWPATINGAALTWRRTKVEVAAAFADGASRWKLVYHDPANDLVLMEGPVEFRG